MDTVTPWWTLCGVWPDTLERWSDFYQAETPQTAEDMAQADAAKKGGRLWITNVFAGRIKGVDWQYAKFVDRNMIDEETLYGE